MLSMQKKLEKVSCHIPNSNESITLSVTLAFADDNSSFLALTMENILNLLEMYNTFELISGMRLNKEKSEMICFNNNEDHLHMIQDNCSFKVVEKIKTLGFVVGSNINIRLENLSILKDKICKIIGFWSKFHF